MPSPRGFSLSSSTDLNSPPYYGWLELTVNSKEFYELRSVLSGTPRPWLEWVDKQVNNYTKRGNPIHNPLQYRLSILWNGIILLQESKFIGDMTENALRRSIIDFMTIQKLKFSDLQIPEWDKKKFGSIFSEYRKSQSDFIAEYFSFYQLYGTFQENWRFPQRNPHKSGFGIIFNYKKQLNLAQFQADMKDIKQIRNDIAHSRRLFRPDEVRNLYKVAYKWLTPLGVNLAERVKGYRQQRPKFLQDLHF